MRLEGLARHTNTSGNTNSRVKVMQLDYSNPEDIGFSACTGTDMVSLISMVTRNETFAIESVFGRG